jgi:hypothetical protein
METLNVILQVTGITTGRAATLLPSVLALSSMAIGWLSLRRRGWQITSRLIGAIIAVCIGLAGLGLSVIHLIRTEDSVLGNGSGRLGAIVAFVLALAGVTVSSIAMVRPNIRKGSD